MLKPEEMIVDGVTYTVVHGIAYDIDPGSIEDFNFDGYDNKEKRDADFLDWGKRDHARKAIILVDMNS